MPLWLLLRFLWRLLLLQLLGVAGALAPARGGLASASPCTRRPCRCWCWGWGCCCCCCCCWLGLQLLGLLLLVLLLQGRVLCTP